jgi:hypothetical protein
MSTPPRRRRNPDASDSGGGGWLPTIAIGLGVVIAGLGIGALVAVLMQRNTGKLAPVAVVVTSTPARPVPPTRLPAPIVETTLEPPHTPRPSATAVKSVAPTPRRSAQPTPRPSPEVTAEASAAPTVKPALEPTPQPSIEAGGNSAKSEAVAAATAASKAARAAASNPVPAETETPARAALVTPAPVPSRTPAEAAAAPAPSAETSGVPAVPAQTASGYDQRASAVVRRYLDALIHGDEKRAYAALGGNGGTLSERAFLDPGARILSLTVTRLDAANASVGCEIVAAKGHYYATYHVTAATGGPYISEHYYIKV